MKAYLPRCKAANSKTTFRETNLSYAGNLLVAGSGSQPASVLLFKWEAIALPLVAVIYRLLAAAP